LESRVIEGLGPIGVRTGAGGAGATVSTVILYFSSHGSMVQDVGGANTIDISARCRP